MIKFLWTAIKIGLVVAAAIWLAERPGSVALEWGVYKITAHLGLVLVGALGALLLALFIYRLTQIITQAPENLARYNARRRQEKGYKALTLGLTAVAAGDGKIANYQSYRAHKFLEEDQGLPLLLQAQAARLKGDEAAANKSFAALLANPDTAFLGVRGLLQAALDHGRHEKALDYAYEALRLYPKQPWVLRTVYDLELRTHDWRKASELLKRLEKAGGIEPQTAISDRAAMETAQGIEYLHDGKREDAALCFKTALKKDAAFLPASIELSDLYIDDKKRTKTQKLLENVLQKTSHPALIQAWANIIPAKAAPDKLARVQWMEKLVDINPDDALIRMAVAQVAIEGKLWGEARAHLQYAEDLVPSAALYRLYAELESQTTKDEDAIADWHDKAAQAPDDPVWQCAQSGIIVDKWQPFGPYGGAFNTVMWGTPSRDYAAGLSDNIEALALETPKA